MPSTTHKLPPEVARRIEARMQRLAPQLAAVLDEAREHGCKYLAMSVRPSSSAEPLNVLLADGSVQVVPE